MSAAISLRQAFDDCVELPGATYRFGPPLPKACVHPLSTPRGHVLSGFEMSDHVWHRGLWFAIKYINGTNFWEEQEPFGVQQSVSQPRSEIIAADAARITHDVTWTSAATGRILDETRTLLFRDDARTGWRSIDWQTELRPTADVTLDRTPYTSWGGYGGLSFRASRSMHNVSFLLPHGDAAQQLKGEAFDWVIMQGLMDGGVDQRVSLAFIDHPSNPRSPSPWYGKSLDFNYINAAFLFHEPMQPKRGEALRFCYRVIWRDGVWTRDEFATIAASFRNEPAGPSGASR